MAFVAALPAIGSAVLPALGTVAGTIGSGIAGLGGALGSGLGALGTAAGAIPGIGTIIAPALNGLGGVVGSLGGGLGGGLGALGAGNIGGALSSLGSGLFGAGSNLLGVGGLPGGFANQYGSGLKGMYGGLDGLLGGVLPGGMPMANATMPGGSGGMGFKDIMGKAGEMKSLLESVQKDPNPSPAAQQHVNNLRTVPPPSIISNAPSGKRVGIYGDMGATPAIGSVMPGGTTSGAYQETQVPSSLGAAYRQLGATPAPYYPQSGADRVLERVNN